MAICENGALRAVVEFYNLPETIILGRADMKYPMRSSLYHSCEVVSLIFAPSFASLFARCIVH